MALHVFLKAGYRQRKVVDAFLAALRAGDFEGLLAVLDPELVFRSDISGAPAEVHGRAQLGQGRDRFSAPGAPAGARPDKWIYRFSLRAARASCEVVTFEIIGETIAAADVITNQERLQQLEFSVLSE